MFNEICTIEEILPIYIYIYIKMNRPANDLKLVFRFFIISIYLCCTRVSDFMSSSEDFYCLRLLLFYSEDCFYTDVFLFNSRICVCKCSVEVNCP